MTAGCGDQERGAERPTMNKTKIILAIIGAAWGLLAPARAKSSSP